MLLLFGNLKEAVLIKKVLEEWYPGDDLVDWCTYSYFVQPDQEMLIFTRKHNKLRKTICKEQFLPFFNAINNNSNVIKAFSYINLDWSSQPTQITNSTFNKVDFRLEMSTYISKRWKKEMEKSSYLKTTDEFQNKSLKNQLKQDV